jgi:peptidyl-prolyl cis-trans isomerase C
MSTKLFLSLLLSASLSTLAFAQADKVVAKVNGVEIKQSDLNAAEEEIGQAAQGLPEAQKRDFLIGFVTDLLITSKAAESKGLDKSADFIKKMQAARQKLLVEAYLTSEAKAKVNDAELKKLYDDEIKKMKPEEEVRARHILLATEEEAKAAAVRLGKGEDFEKLAKELSKDPGSADGGDLGYFTRETMVKEFSDVAFVLEKGKVSAPVKSQFGFHLIKVEDKRAKELPAFDAVKTQLQEYLVRKVQSEMITALRAAAKIEKMDAPAEKPTEKPAEKK